MMAAGRSSLTRQAHQRLIDALLRGEIAPGDRLVITELAERLQMSRTPVRDALKRLASSAVVEPHGGSGYGTVDPTPRDVRDLVDLLALLEPDAAVELCRRPKRVRTEMAARLETVDRDSVGAHRFHSALGEAATNPYLREAVVVLNERLVTARRALVGPCLGDGAHDAIVAAVVAGDADGARRHVAHHLTRVREQIYGRHPAASATPSPVPARTP